MSAFARAVTPLRDRRLSHRLPCVGCQQTVATRDTWALCTRCQGDAWSVASARVRGLSGTERRGTLNQFWSSQEAVGAGLAELRQGVGAS